MDTLVFIGKDYIWHNTPYTNQRIPYRLRYVYAGLYVELDAFEAPNLPGGIKIRFRAREMETDKLVLLYDNHHGKTLHAHRIVNGKMVEQLLEIRSLMETVREFIREVPEVRK